MLRGWSTGERVGKRVHQSALNLGLATRLRFCGSAPEAYQILGPCSSGGAYSSGHTVQGAQKGAWPRPLTLTPGWPGKHHNHRAGFTISHLAVLAHALCYILIEWLTNRSLSDHWTRMPWIAFDLFGSKNLSTREPYFTHNNVLNNMQAWLSNAPNDHGCAYPFTKCSCIMEGLDTIMESGSVHTLSSTMYKSLQFQHCTCFWALFC